VGRFEAQEGQETRALALGVVRHFRGTAEGRGCRSARPTLWGPGSGGSPPTATPLGTLGPRRATWRVDGGGLWTTGLRNKPAAPQFSTLGSSDVNESPERVRLLGGRRRHSRARKRRFGADDEGQTRPRAPRAHRPSRPGTLRGVHPTSPSAGANGRPGPPSETSRGIVASSSPLDFFGAGPLSEATEAPTGSDRRSPPECEHLLSAVESGEVGPHRDFEGLGARRSRVRPGRGPERVSGDENRRRPPEGRPPPRRPRARRAGAGPVSGSPHSRGDGVERVGSVSS